jgi:hypothetical protein
MKTKFGKLASELDPDDGKKVEGEKKPGEKVSPCRRGELQRHMYSRIHGLDI